MGYIKLDIMRNEKIEKFVFMHGAFIDTKWSAKFIDNSNCIIEIFESDDMLQCLKNFAKFLNDFGIVININAEPCEGTSIEILCDNLQQLS